MRYPAGETAQRHQKIIEEASRLFKSKGVGGASIGDVMKASGLTHGGFYAHFDSKEALICASLEHAMDQTIEEMHRVASYGENRKAVFLSNYLSASHRDHPEVGCALSAFVADAAREPVMRHTFTTRLKAMISALGESLPWRGGRSKESQVICFTAAMVGAVVIARAVDDPAFSDSILASVQHELLNR